MNIWWKYALYGFLGGFVVFIIVAILTNDSTEVGFIGVMFYSAVFSLIMSVVPGLMGGKIFKSGWGAFAGGVSIPTIFIIMANS